MLALLLACAQPAPAPPPEVAIDALGGLSVYEDTLPNGLELLVLPDPGAAAVELQTWYRVGSADEEPGHTGLAHLFEHLMFGDTADYTAAEFLSTLEAIGAREPDAWTWLDQTVYVHTLPPEGLDEVLALEASRMRGLVLDEATLAREREVVRSERRFRIDSKPDAWLNERLWAAAFQRHPYGRPTAGSGVDLAALTTADIAAFYRRWYAPDSATLVVVGPVDPAALSAMTRAHFGALPPARPQRATPAPEAPPAAPRVEVVPITAAADRLRVGFRAPRIGHPDLAALAVLDAALVSGPSARLRRVLVGTGLASDIDSSLEGLRQESLWTFAATARPGVDAGTLRSAFDREIQRVLDEGIGPEELARARDLALLDALTPLDSGSGRAEALGWYQAVGGDWRGLQAYVDALACTSARDVALAAEAWLRPEEATVILGDAGAPALPGDADAPSPAALTPSPAALTPSPTALTPSPAALTPSPTALTPSPAARQPAGPPDMERGESREVRAHGAALFLEYDPTSPVLRCVVGWPRGAASESRPGQAALTAAAIARTLELEAADLGLLTEVEVTHDTIRLELRVLPARWPALAALLRHRLAAPGFGALELEGLKAEQLGRLTAELDDDVALAFLGFARGWYGPDHPYGRSPEGTAAGIASLTAADLAAFHREQLVSGGMVLGLAGAFDAGARADLTAIAEALDGAPPPAPSPPLPPLPTSRRVIIVDKPARSQLQVLIGHEGARRGDGWPAAYLANAVFGRHGARGLLSQALRGQRGWSYFAYSQHWPRRQAPAWTAHFAPSTERGVEAAALVLSMMSEVAAAGVDPQSLEAVRKAELDEGRYLADTAAERLGIRTWAGLTGDDPLALLAELPAVSGAQVDRALASGLHPERALVVMVGTADVLRLSAAALGPVAVIPYTDFQ